MTGARTGVLVLPSMHVGTTRAFVFRDGRGGAEIWLHVVGLETTGKTLAAWGDAASRMALSIKEIGVGWNDASPGRSASASGGLALANPLSSSSARIVATRRPFP